MPFKRLEGHLQGGKRYRSRSLKAISYRATASRRYFTSDVTGLRKPFMLVTKALAEPKRRNRSSRTGTWFLCLRTMVSAQRNDELGKRVGLKRELYLPIFYFNSL
ncbi:hypothetical protein SAMN04487825_102166 [Prevotella sp. kh1p2]|nr:hypothetical protein SAMN04487825_102166 [Prevotella sp. kh1p2]SNU10388.1 hypothetical protein SAMN06298210_102150 [Prevotellaceae bacterium KH2P17]